MAKCKIKNEWNGCKLKCRAEEANHPGSCFDYHNGVKLIWFERGTRQVWADGNAPEGE